MKKEKVLMWIKGMTKANKIIAIAIILVVVIGLSVGLVFQNKESKLTTISTASLQKIIGIDELDTITYTYNAVATKYKDDNPEDKVMYYIAYEGTVKAGINFNEIKFEIFEDEKKISIIVPEVEIHEMSINIETMDSIFVKKKYETEKIAQEAYKLCSLDLEKRIEKENMLFETAKENAQQSVKALFEPWIETIDDEYIVEVK